MQARRFGVSLFTCALLFATTSGAFVPQLRFQHYTIDTSRYTPFVHAASIRGVEAAELGLLQLATPPDPRQLEELEGLGLVPVTYVHEQAYLVRGLPAARRAAVAAGLARWEGPYVPLYRLPPSLPATAQGMPQSATLALTAQLAAGFDHLPGWTQRLARRPGAGVVSQTDFGDWRLLRLELRRDDLSWLVNQPDLIYLEPTPTYRLLGERAARILASPGFACPPSTGYDQDLARYGVDGRDVVIQFMDSGLDHGHTTNGHPDFAGRVQAVVNATENPSGADGSGHGTLNAGIAVGLAATGLRDKDGFLMGQGVAPGARVFATKIFNDQGEATFEQQGFSLGQLVQEARQAGVTISNNSWGSATAGGYNSDAAAFDRLTRDTTPSLPGNQPMLFVCAAGNDGPNPETLNAPATAKNVIAVAASENCDAEGTDCGRYGPSTADSPVDLSLFSSRGPTRDGRQGVTLAAVGTHMLGPAGTAPHFTGNGICQVWPGTNGLYGRSSGTSHAAPVVSGAAALFTQQIRARLGLTPSPALVRAAMVNAAEDMAGGADGAGALLDHRPGPRQGWGRLFLDGLLLAFEQSAYYDQRALLTPANATWQWVVRTTDPSKPLRITLAWTDKEALGAITPQIINDLDLVVESETDGTRYLGNVFAGGVSIPGGEPDRLNTLESVVIPNPSGLYRIRVRAHRLAGDGVPGNPHSLDQDFAVAVRNGTRQPRQGFVYFDAHRYPCDATMTITLSDWDLAGQETYSLMVTSQRTGDAKPVTLTESPRDSGIFSGPLRLGSGAGSTLHAEHDDLITVVYQDADVGDGSPGTITATAGTDCLPPVIDNVEVAEVDATSAWVRWHTDEAATGSVLVGATCGQATQVFHAAAFATNHEVRLDGLAQDTPHAVLIQATDEVGNTTLDGQCHYFRTGMWREACVFTDNADGGLGNWEAQPPWGIEGQRFSDSPGGNYGNHVDASLTSLPLALDELADPRLRLTHRFSLAPGDQAAVEVSSDNATWWPVAVFTGTRAMDLTDDIALEGLAFASGARLRFRIQTGEGPTDQGWSIDRVEVCEATVFHRAGKLSLMPQALGCQGELRVWVDDLDLEGVAQQTVLLESQPTGDGVVVTLTPTHVFPARLMGTVDVLQGASTSDGALQVDHGDTIVAYYDDADDGLGEGAPRTATAAVDCVPPIISQLRVEEVHASGAVVRWRTNEPSTSTVWYGTQGCDANASMVVSRTLTTEHRVTLSGLEEDTRYRYAVAGVDAGGNQTRVDNGGACLYFTTGRLVEIVLFEDDMESGAGKWIAQPPWAITTEAPHGGDYVWSDSPGGNYADGLADGVLLSTVDIDLTGARDSRLHFWHRHEFQPTFGGPPRDYGVVQVSSDDGATWSTPLRLFHDTQATYVEEIVDLSAYDDAPAIRVGFRLISDSLINADGWYIDDVSVRADELLTYRGSVRATRPAYRCNDLMEIVVVDLGAVGQSFVSVQAISTLTDLERVFLSPVQDRPWEFRGVLPTMQAQPGDPVPGDNVLWVEHGATVWLIYNNFDDGTGGPADPIHQVPVDCVPPLIFDVTVAEREDGALLGWRTSEPTQGFVELGASCAERVVEATRARFDTHHSVAVTGLSPFGNYWAAIRARDVAGNETLDDNQGACHAVRTGFLTCFLDDDMELDSGFWIADPPWERVLDARQSGDGHSPVFIYVDSPAPAFYTRGRTVNLRSIPIGIPAIGEARLRFAHRYNFFDAGDTADYGRVEYSTDGIFWNLARQYTGDQHEWTHERLQLTGLQGATQLHLRFSLVADDTNNVADGWFLDDVSLCAVLEPTSNGQLAFSAPRYRCGDVVRLTLTDADLAGTGMAQAALASAQTGGMLIVPLHETMSGSGTFVGHASTAREPALDALWVDDDDQLTAIYHDEHREGGGSESITTHAHMACSPVAQLSLALAPQTAVAPLGGIVSLDLDLHRKSGGPEQINLSTIRLGLYYDPAVLAFEGLHLLAATLADEGGVVQRGFGVGVVELALSGQGVDVPGSLGRLDFRFVGERDQTAAVGWLDADLRDLAGVRLPTNLLPAQVTAGNPPRAENAHVPNADRAVGLVALVFDLFDDESHPCWIQVEYRLLPDGAYQPATPAAGTQLVELASSPTGVRHVFLWNALDDVPITPDGTRVMLRVTPFDPEPGQPAHTGEVHVNARFFGTGVSPKTWSLYE